MKKLLLAIVAVLTLSFTVAPTMAYADWSHGTAKFKGNKPSKSMTSGNIKFFYNGTIRGNTYDTILANIRKATASNICFYMAINQINKDYVDHVCRLARDTDHVKAVSFNFHTPYPDTKELALTKEEKANCCQTIIRMMQEGCPVFNLKSAFPYLIENKFPTPCHQCLVIEAGKISTCGRCIEVPGLCEQCGYFFVAEYTLLFRGNLKIIFEMLRTYLKYI